MVRSATLRLIGLRSKLVKVLLARFGNDQKVTENTIFLRIRAEVERSTKVSD
jgi:hypothetical protein